MSAATSRATMRGTKCEGVGLGCGRAAFVSSIRSCSGIYVLGTGVDVIPVDWSNERIDSWKDVIDQTNIVHLGV